MRTLFGVTVLLSTTIAAAQPGATPPTGGVDPGASAAADPWTFHHGMTFDAGLGIGFTHATLYASGDGKTSTVDSDVALAGAVGLSGWVNPQLAVGARISGIQLKYTIYPGLTVPTTGLMVNALVGPDVQYWLAPNVWLGGGVVLSNLRLVDNADCTGDHCSIYGFGFDLRAGYSFGSSGPHTFSMSVEANAGYLPETDLAGSKDSWTIRGISIFADYQYL